MFKRDGMATGHRVDSLKRRSYKKEEAGEPEKT